MLVLACCSLRLRANCGSASTHGGFWEAARSQAEALRVLLAGSHRRSRLVQRWADAAAPAIELVTHGGPTSTCNARKLWRQQRMPRRTSSGWLCSSWTGATLDEWWPWLLCKVCSGLCWRRMGVCCVRGQPVPALCSHAYAPRRYALGLASGTSGELKHHRSSLLPYGVVCACEPAAWRRVRCAWCDVACAAARAHPGAHGFRGCVCVCARCLAAKLVTPWQLLWLCTSCLTKTCDER